MCCWSVQEVKLTRPGNSSRRAKRLRQRFDWKDRGGRARRRIETARINSAREDGEIGLSGAQESMEGRLRAWVCSTGSNAEERQTGVAGATETQREEADAVGVGRDDGIEEREKDGVDGNGQREVQL
jgi:hypothetical protein